MSAGTTTITSDTDAAQAIYLHADGGTSETIQLHADQGTGVASINLLSDVGGITLNAAGLASEDAINLSAAAGGIDMDAALQINIDSSESAADAIVIDASDAAGGININAGTGGIDLNAGGIVSMTPATDVQASPTATATINANVGVATFTGFTTASAASQVFTITNAVCTAASAILVSVSNLGGNDAQMTVTRVTPGAGSFTVTTVNNGAAALNGDVIITFWIIAA
ncbi:MAG: hypothetical protein R3230_01490 [Nitrosopumilaceae archaeon]|nr:hypothetical protein [Nitrosopumilaceae archaeon]